MSTAKTAGPAGTGTRQTSRSTTNVSDGHRSFANADHAKTNNTHPKSIRAAYVPLAPTPPEDGPPGNEMLCSDSIVDLDPGYNAYPSLLSSLSGREPARPAPSLEHPPSLTAPASSFWLGHSGFRRAARVKPGAYQPLPPKQAA